MRRPVSLFLLLLFLSPLIFLLTHIQVIETQVLFSFFSVLFVSSIQSAASAALSLVVGGVGALGLVRLNGAKKNVTEALLLLPSFVPSIFIILSLLLLIRPYPFGMSGVVLAHIIIYSGLVAVTLSRALIAKFGSLSEVAYAMGVSSNAFLAKVILPLSIGDIRKLFVFVFASCLASFSIPMILGGAKPVTLEIFIYESILIERNWAGAAFAGGVQYMLLYFLGGLSFSKMPSQKNHRTLVQVGHSFCVIPLIVISLVLVLANGLSAYTGIRSVLDNQHLVTAMLRGIGPSLLSGLYVFLFVFMLGLGSLYASLGVGSGPLSFQKLLVAGCTPSATAVGIGLSFLSIERHSENFEVGSILLISFIFVIFVFASLFRLKLSSTMEGLRGQIQVAQTLGCGDFLILRKIILPQAFKDLIWISGLAAFWMSGEFALPSLISPQDLTLAMMAKSLLIRYQVDEALAFVTVGLTLGAGLAYTLGRLAYGHSSKSRA